MELQVPSVLAQLPRPLAVSSGRYHFGESNGLVAAKKRKRYEVVAAVEGEGINIYNVQFPKLVTSYATPPQSSFSCSPCSVRQKDAQTSVTKRWTYCALQAPEKKIQCFLDESSDTQVNQLKVATKIFKFGRKESSVVALNTIPTAPSSETQDAGNCFDVVAVQEDGQVRRFSPDLEIEKFHGYATCSNDGDKTTEYLVASSFFMSLEDAQKFLLRRRQDILANVLQHGPSSTILAIVQQPTEAKVLSPSDVRINVFVLPAANAASASAAGRLKSIMSIRLPDPEGFKPLEPSDMHWDFNTASALLTLAFPAGIINYDISQYTLKIPSALTFEGGKLSSSLRISPQSLMAARDSSISIYNTRYQSVQAHLSLKHVLDIVPTTAKTADFNVEFVTYFAKLGLAVAVSGVTLLAFDLTPIQGKYGAVSRKHTRDGLLIHAIGRGIPAAKSPLALPSEPTNAVDALKTDDVEQWNQIKDQLQVCVDSKDTTKFDDIVGQELPKLLVDSGNRQFQRKAKHMPSTTKFFDTDNVFFLLSKIFTLKRVRDSTDHELHISFLPAKTIHWLVNATYLTSSNVKLALRQAHGLEALPHLKPGAMIQAIIDAKPSLRLLNQVLRGPVHLDPDELVYTVQACLELARKHASTQVDGGVSNASSGTLPDESTSISEPSTSKALVANPQTTNSEALLTNAVAILNLSLIRLELLPQSTVTSSIRANLSNSDTLSIIHHLRHALATGGHTSRLMETGSAATTLAKVPILSLGTIVSSLTACIDAIGPNGWISAAAFADSADSEASLIADIKTEVSAALAGVEEAAYLKGILREFIRYSETMHAGPKKLETDAAGTAPFDDAKTVVGPARSKLKVKRRERNNGAEVVVYETPDYTAGLLGPEDSQLLPLSLRKQDATQAVSKTKTHRGTGEVTKRSTREMGYLRRKAVGKYSFERIIV
ncbi:hypothetical protein KEM54_006910 [Ascosphaera aggregata]|nr:hypothetical protein KEM54_006910 [Ascosphaera aggregata]